MTRRTERHQRVSASVTRAADSDGGVVLHETPLPEKPVELGWRDYLIMLLHIAAELEHALMVQYLYGAYSLGGEQAKDEEAKVRKWRDAILTVSKEEMGHLLTVQNVLCLLGGPISFEREDYPWSSRYYPFEFCLEPLTVDSLAKYVYAEMPQEFGPNDDEDRKTAAAAREILGIAEGIPVGEIYDQIIKIIGDESKIPDSDFNPDSYSRQACFDDWGRSYRPGPLPPHAKSTDVQPNIRGTRLIVARMATRTEALAALRDVAGQGESPHQRTDTKTEESHFDRFGAVFNEMRAIQKAKPGWSATRKVPRNPMILDPAKNAPNATHITAEPSRTWASLFNVRYRMLLSYLSHTYAMPRLPLGDEDGLFASIVTKIFGEMYNLKTLAGILVRLPLADPNDERRAGPTFQMPYTLVLPASDMDIWRQHRDLVVSSQLLVEDLLHPQRDNLAHAPADGRKYLMVLQDLDIQSMIFIDQVIAGLQPLRRSVKGMKIPRNVPPKTRGEAS